MEADPQTDQEMMSQRDEQHVVMPAEPTAHFVMIETNFGFGSFENRFDGPAHAAKANELDHGCGSGGIAEVEFDFGRIIGYSNRVIALFDHPRFIDQGHPIRFCQRFGYQLLMDLDHWLRFPRALANKMLQAAHFLVQLKRYPFDVFARRITRQATQIDFAPFQMLYSLKGWLKQINVIHHFVHKLLNILLGQIEFWRRASFGYNFLGMVFSFSFPLGRGRRKIPYLSLSGYPACLSSTLRCNTKGPKGGERNKLLLDCI